MGHCEMIGLIGPKASYPSRLTERTQIELSNVEPLKFRDAENSMFTIRLKSVCLQIY